MNAAERQSTVPRPWARLVFFLIPISGPLATGIVLFIVWWQAHVFHPEVGLRLLCDRNEDNRENLSSCKCAQIKLQNFKAADLMSMLGHRIALEAVQVSASPRRLVLGVIKASMRWLVFQPGVKILHLL